MKNNNLLKRTLACCSDLLPQSLRARTWWGLRTLARPEYVATMNHHEHVDFFHAATSGFLKLTFVSLGKIFDPGRSVVSMRQMLKMLSEHQRTAEARTLAKRLGKHDELVRRVLAIRNKSVSHNALLFTRDEVYDQYGVTPDEIRELVTDVCEGLNDVAKTFGSSTVLSEGERQERSVLHLLETLKRGRT